MFDHTKGSLDLDKYAFQVQKKFIHNNIDGYPLFDKLLGFQREMNQAIAPKYNERLAKIPKPKHHNFSSEMWAEFGALGLCASNIAYLYHAIAPLEKGSIHVCANIIRPVYESIPKMFYLLSHPEHAPIIISKEYFEIWITRKKYDDFLQNKNLSRKKHLDEFIKIDGKNYFGGKNIEVTDDFLNDYTHKFNNSWYRKQIYTNESLKLQDNVYGSLSMSSHANVMRTEVLEEDHEIVRKRLMKILTDLAFFNLFVYVSNSSEVLEVIHELDDTIDFLIECQQELKYHLAMTNLYPDVPEYLENLIDLNFPNKNSK